MATRFPRTRGDGPAIARWHAGDPRFPPHTRGWTVRAAPRSGSNGVSPAHAGMDRLLRLPVDRSWSFPRTRGDGPGRKPFSTLVAPFPPHTRGWTCVERRVLSPIPVSPAHAGMDLVRAVREIDHLCFPRTRGDGPPAQPSGSRRGGVSPAHAGMDRYQTLRRCVNSCFPRTRGDGPGQERGSHWRHAFPPHTRGWTQRLSC